MSEFSLPGSSFAELKKIIRSYASAKPDASLDEISALAAVHKTIVSRNNKFLSELSIIQGGQKKTITDLGKKLGRAIEHAQLDDERSEWANAIRTNEPLSSVMTTVRIKGGMTEAELAKHILYVSGQSSSSSNKTGSRCVQDVLVASGLLSEKDGGFTVSSPAFVDPSLETAQSLKEAATILPDDPSDKKPNEPTEISSPIKVQPNITINVQLQLPETKDGEVYEKLFRALKENLL